MFWARGILKTVLRTPKTSISYLLLSLLLLLTFFLVIPSMLPKTPKAENIHFSLGNLHTFENDGKIMEMTQSDCYSYSLRSWRPLNFNHLPSTLTATLTYLLFGGSFSGPEDPKSSKHVVFPTKYACFQNDKKWWKWLRVTATLTHLGPQDPKMSITYLLLLLLLLLTFFLVIPSIVPKTPKAQNIHFSLGNLHSSENDSEWLLLLLTYSFTKPSDP